MVRPVFRVSKCIRRVSTRRELDRIRTVFQLSRNANRHGLMRRIEREKCGERGRNRTFNLLIKSQLLCQLSYAPTVGISY
jgi:hypothetical protein